MTLCRELRKPVERKVHSQELLLPQRQKIETNNCDELRNQTSREPLSLPINRQLGRGLLKHFRDNKISFIMPKSSFNHNDSTSESKLVKYPETKIHSSQYKDSVSSCCLLT